MNKIIFLLLLCLNAMMVIQAENPDSIYYRDLRERFIKEYADDSPFVPTFTFNEDIISLEKYLSMPEDSIGGCTVLVPDSYNGLQAPLFYVYSKGREPAQTSEYRGDSPHKSDVHGSTYYPTMFYTSGGIPPCFKEGADSLWNFIRARRDLPDYILNDENIQATIKVYCCIDEEGRLWNTRVGEISFTRPVRAVVTADFDPSDNSIIGLKGKGMFSDEFAEKLEFVQRDALKVVRTMPDFEPGRVFLSPVKYRITIPIRYSKGAYYARKPWVYRE